MALGKTVFFKKLAEGGVSLYLQDVEGNLPAKWFSMDHKVPRIGVPMNYALTLFIDATIEKMMDRNYFVVENLDDLLAVARERGFADPSPEQEKKMKEPKRSNEIILAILKAGNAAKLQELFKSVDKQRAFDLSVENSKSFSLDTVQKIEEILGMAITTED